MFWRCLFFEPTFFHLHVLLAKAGELQTLGFRRNTVFHDSMPSTQVLYRAGGGQSPIQRLLTSG